MKKIKERTIYFMVYMLILIPIGIVSFMTGCLIFGMIMFVIAGFCIKSFIENVKAYRKYNNINAQFICLKEEDKLSLYSEIVMTG